MSTNQNINPKPSFASDLKKTFNFAVAGACGAAVSLAATTAGERPPTMPVKNSVTIECHPAFPGTAPGKAEAKAEKERLILQNAILAGEWKIAEGVLRPVRFADKLSGSTIDAANAECFQVTVGQRTMKASEMKVVSGLRVEELLADPVSPNLGRHFPGKQIAVTLAAEDSGLEVEWQAILRDGANYIRQSVTFKAVNDGVLIGEVALWDLVCPGVALGGTVAGSPAIAGNAFFAYEHPLSRSTITDQRLRCVLWRNLAIKPGEHLVQTSVFGVVPEGQLRRAFLYYLERERAHPFRPFTTWNSWLSINNLNQNEKLREKPILDVMEEFGRELVEKRQMVMDAFVLDDGWDDCKTLWKCDKYKFPNGFTPLLAAARKYGSTLGFWFSPLGGYGVARNERLEYGKGQGFEMTVNGFSLAGPRYYGRIREACLDMIRNNGAKYLKFDGLDGKSIAETEAYLRLINDLRAEAPDLFVDVTCGTWPSPYWLFYGDSVWRGAADSGHWGLGPEREQRLNYCDGVTYKLVVRCAPLFPHNSMLRDALEILAPFPDKGVPINFKRLVQTYPGSPTILCICANTGNAAAWDMMAEVFKWERANADVLVDKHWVGRDPGGGDPYGWAAWSNRKGILVLRQPDEISGRIEIDIGKVFELPKDAPKKYVFKSPWKEDENKVAIELTAGQLHAFDLAPFEVLVFDATPVE